MAYLGQISIFACNFAPNGWAQCNGQVLPIPANQGLFQVLGTTYGGNGRSTFGLPQLANVSPLGAGNGPGLSPRVNGATGGERVVALNASQLAVHSHNPGAVVVGTAANPANAVWAQVGNVRPAPQIYAKSMVNPQLLTAGIVGSTGSGTPHNNLMPYQVVNICIALVQD